MNGEDVKGLRTAVRTIGNLKRACQGVKEGHWSNQQ